jgi:hypothetical protein
MRKIFGIAATPDRLLPEIARDHFRALVPELNVAGEIDDTYAGRQIFKNGFVDFGFKNSCHLPA